MFNVNAAVALRGWMPNTPIPPSPWWMWVVVAVFLLVAFFVSRARRWPWCLEHKRVPHGCADSHREQPALTIPLNDSEHGG